MMQKLFFPEIGDIRLCMVVEHQTDGDQTTFIDVLTHQYWTSESYRYPKFNKLRQAAIQKVQNINGIFVVGFTRHKVGKQPDANLFASYPIIDGIDGIAWESIENGD